MLPHAIYFEALAALPDSRSHQWREIAAGLTVLRLVDDWLDYEENIIANEGNDLARVKAIVADIPQNQTLRSVLSNITMAIQHAEKSSFSVVAPNLLAYALELERDAQYALSEDVFQGIRERALVLGDKELVTQSCLKLGRNYRMTRRLDLAEEFYTEGLYYAKTTGNRLRRLTANTGLVKLYVQRGDLQSAIALSDDTILEARQMDNLSALSIALHDRGFVSIAEENYPESATRLQQALQLPGADKSSILGDLGNVLMNAGDIQRSREINYALSVTARERHIRWIAAVNLMCAAAYDGQRDEFERYISTLDVLATRPICRFEYHLVAADGYKILGQPHAAVRHAEAAAAMGALV